MKRQLLLFTGVIALFLVGCKTQKISFTQVYEKELPETPSRVAAMKPNGEYILGLEQEPKWFGSPEAFVVNAEGEVLWYDQMRKLGDIEKSPDRVTWIWELDRALFFSKNFNFKLSCVDLKTGKEVWSYKDNNRNYATTGRYFNEANGYMFYTPRGLAMISMDDGTMMWEREDLEGSTWQFIENSVNVLVSTSEKLTLIDPANGRSVWTIDQNIGSTQNADYFMEDGVAVFYGSSDENLGSAIAESIVRSSLGSVGNAAVNAAKGGLVKDDIYYVDLEEGVIKWENKLYTDGNHQLVLKDNKLVAIGLVINVFDRNTGEVVWRSISEERMDRENVFEFFRSLTGFDLTSQDFDPQDLIFDNSLYAIYPESMDNAVAQNKTTLRRYNLDNGELFWKSKPIDINITYYFGQDGILFLVGYKPGFVRSKPVVSAYNPANGEMMYQQEIAGGFIEEFFVRDGRLYIHSGYALECFDAKTGAEIPLSYPSSSSVIDAKNLDQGLFVAYGDFYRSTSITLHNPADFSVIKQMDVPGYLREQDYRGGTFFLMDRDEWASDGIIALNLENFSVKGYLLNSQQGSRTTTVGGKTTNEVFRDYHLFLTQDGQYIYEIDKDVLKKYAVED